MVPEELVPEETDVSYGQIEKQLEDHRSE